jgi:cytochrome P450
MIRRAMRSLEPEEYEGRDMHMTETASDGNDRVEAKCPYLVDYQPLSPDELQDPYPTFRWARKSAPVFYSDVSHTPGVGIWSIARHDDILAALRDTETFSSAGQRSPARPPEHVRHRMPDYPWATTVLTQDGQEHKRSRRILQAPFTPQSVRAREGAVRAIMDRLVSQVGDSGNMDFLSQIAFPLSLGTISEAIGFPEDRFEDLKRWVSVAFSVIGNALTDEKELGEANETVADFYEFMVELVQDRLGHPRDDYLSAMVQTTAPDGSPEPTSTLVRSVFTLIVAGFETTAQAMSLGLWQLLSNREQWQLLLEDRSLIPGAVEEMLRYRSMVQRLFRTVTRDVDVAGVTIPQGSLVALLVASSHRDTDAYANADDLDIRRRSNTHLAFGRGAHFCVGAPLARLEINVMLESMLRAFPSLRLADGFRPEWLPDIRMAILRHLPLCWDVNSDGS